MKKLDILLMILIMIGVFMFISGFLFLNQYIIGFSILLMFLSQYIIEGIEIFLKNILTSKK